jgi:hypothetical protein
MKTRKLFLIFKNRPVAIKKQILRKFENSKAGKIEQFTG